MTISQSLLASDARQAPRASLYLAASLYCDGCPTVAKIRNISNTGALLELRDPPAQGSLVQLVRGSLIAHAVVAWSTDGRCGLRFVKGVEVQKWRASPANAEQQRVDEILGLVRTEAKSVPADRKLSDLAESAGDGSLTYELRLAADLLRKLEDSLSRNNDVVAAFAEELQHLDIAIQIIGMVEAIVSNQNDLSIDTAKIENFRRSADQALRRV